jgi:hypothetical protein
MKITIRHLQGEEMLDALYTLSSYSLHSSPPFQDDQEFECGVREGTLLYITKIPYNTKQYLAESDPTLKRYYACHCPWAREAIKNGNIRLNAVFCNCSGGFSKKPWEVIFGQTLQVDLLESALKGDYRCRFAVHLPEKLEIE